MLLPFIRVWLPAIVTLVGVVVIIVGGGDDISLEGGAGIIGAGLAIWLMNVLFRVGLDNDRDRDEEDAARDFFDLHGRWPDEAAPPGERTQATDPAGADPAAVPPAPRRPGDPPSGGPPTPSRARPGAARTPMRPRRPG